MKRLVTLHFLLVLLLAGCASATQARPTPIPPTETPAPIKAGYHEWEAQPVVAEVVPTAGMMGEELAWGYIPTMVVYANGMVLVSDKMDYHFRFPSIRRLSLSTSELCSWLEKINASGFFDFQQHDYHPPNITDTGGINIRINAWRSKEIDIFDVAPEYQPNPFPVAIGKPLQELELFQQSSAAVPYLPDQIALRITRNDANAENITTLSKEYLADWPTSLPSIASLAPNLENPRDVKIVSLYGKDLATVASLFEKSILLYFTENEHFYAITARPVLPYEILDSNTSKPWQPRDFENSPLAQMSCPDTNTPN